MRSRPGALAPDWLVFAALAAIAVALFAVVRLPPDLARGQRVPPPEVAATPPAHVQDFAFVFNYARRAVEERGTSPYTYDAHRRFYRAWLGPGIRSALCFPYGPTTMLLLLPLFGLATGAAWLVWNLAAAWLAAWAARAASSGDARARSWSRLVVVSPSAFHCLLNGQTGLLTTGCFVAALSLGMADGPGAATAGVALFALGMKPPLAVLAAVALLAAGHRRAVWIGAGLTVVGLVAAVGWWTPAILGDYATLLRRYNLVDADEIVRAGCVPSAMTNLRAVLLRTGWLDDSQAFVASSWTLAVALLPPLAAVVRRRAWPLEVAASWVVMAYLLFAPHLSPTEDLLLLVPLGLLLRTRARAPWHGVALVAGCVGPPWIGGSALQLAPGLPWMAAAPLVGFALKLAPAAVVVASLVAQGNAPAMGSPRRST